MKYASPGNPRMKTLEFLEILTLALCIPALLIIVIPLGLAAMVGWLIGLFS